MKHLPNLLTLANLFCGCLAITYLLTAQPYYYMSVKDGMPTWQWAYGGAQVMFGCMFIGLAAICDMLDGFAARALKVFSPIGKDLDSLADMVSFGVAPAVIFFKYLADSLMGEKNALDASMIGMAPAFLIACFAALRLAKFNITAASQRSYFIGMPTPAVGIFAASLPFVTAHNPYNMGAYLQNKWLLYGLVALLCWLMVSKAKFIKMIPSKWSVATIWPQLLLVAVTIAASVASVSLAIPVAFLAYVLLSLVYKQPEVTENTNETTTL